MGDAAGGPDRCLVLLDRWAWHRAVGAEHAAVARERLEPRSATLAVIEQLASVGGHSLGRLMTAFRTGERRLQLHQSVVAFL